MGIMDNLKQAVTELAGQDEKSPTGAGDGEEASKAFQPFVPESYSVRVSDEEEQDDDGGVKEMINNDASARFSQNLDIVVARTPATVAGGTVIAAGTVVDGNISSNEDVSIFGVVNGDVLNANKLVIHGEVAGSISAKDVNLVDCIIAGNVVAQNNTEMTKDSCILGDLTTENVVVSGKVKGNIEAKGNGIFKREAIVLGNISVGTIVIEGGAKMRGFITTTSGDKEVDEDFFPQK